MQEKTQAVKKLSMTSTKHEMLDGYNTLLKQLQDREKQELRPQEELEKKKTREVIEVADALSSEEVVREVANLRMEIGKILTQVSDYLQEEVLKYGRVKEAIGIREKQLEEIYGIEKAAQSLVALLDAQAKKREEFESETLCKKEELSEELESLRLEQEQEKKLYAMGIKERDEAEARKRQREKEEYEYGFKREQQLAKNKFEDEKAKLEKELQIKKEAVEKQLIEREKKIIENEEKARELQKKVDSFPKELEAATASAVKEAVEKVQADARNREELLKKTYEGEKNVLITRLGSLEKNNQEQKDQIIRLAQQLESAYQKVEGIAVKSVSGFLEAKSSVSSQARAEEQGKRQPQ